MSLNIIIYKIEKKTNLQRIFVKILEETLKNSCVRTNNTQGKNKLWKIQQVMMACGEVGIDSDFLFTLKSLGFAHVFLRWMVSLVQIVVAVKYHRNLDNSMSIYLIVGMMVLKGFSLSYHRHRY